MATIFSGQITVTTAGTAVQGASVAPYDGVRSGFYIRALSANTGLIYIGNDGADDVTSANGYELAAGNAVFIPCKNLNELWFDSSVNGEKACWLKG